MKITSVEIYPAGFSPQPIVDDGGGGGEGGGGGGDAYATVVLADTPLVYWRLGELSGTVVNDSSLNNHDGTYHGAPTLGSPSLILGADKSIFVNDRDTDYAISDDDFGDVIYTAFTLECWVKFSINTNGQQPVSLLDITYDHWLSIYASGISGDDPTVSFDWGGTSGSGGGSFPDPISIDVPHHLVVTFDGTFTKAYVDGIQVFTVDDSAHGGPDFTGAVVHLCAGGDNTGFTEGMDAGSVDEVAFYNHAISADRVLAHFTAGSTGEGGGGGGEESPCTGLPSASGDVADITGPTDHSDPSSTYSGTTRTLTQKFQLLWNAGFRTALDLQIGAAIAMAESSSDIGCRNWHPEYGFRTEDIDTMTFLITVPAGAKWDDGTTVHVMRSDRGMWQISDHWYPQFSDADCDDPQRAACIVRAIKLFNDPDGWTQWDTFNDESYLGLVNIDDAQAFVDAQ